MCEKNCVCIVCEIESAETKGWIRIDELEADSLTREQLRNLDLFDEFVKAGLGS